MDFQKSPSTTHFAKYLLFGLNFLTFVSIHSTC